jgi:hypothetical protein
MAPDTPGHSISDVVPGPVPEGVYAEMLVAVRRRDVQP